MKKLIITSFCFLIGSVPTYSDDLLKESSPLKRGPRSSLLSKNIEIAEGIIKVPSVQPLNSPTPPKILLSLKGKIPKIAFREVPALAPLMNSIGVKATDPLFVVVQGYSGLPIAPNTMFQLKPKDYFSQPNVRAAVLGIDDPLFISNNMTVPGLSNKHSTAFLGFYKGSDSAPNGKQIDKGTAVIHVLLNQKDENGLAKLLGTIKKQTPTIGDVFNTFENTFKNDPDFAEIVDIIDSVIDEEQKIKAQAKKAPQRKTLTPSVKVPPVRKTVVRTPAPKTTTVVRTPAPRTTTVVRTPAPRTTTVVRTPAPRTTTVVRRSAPTARRVVPAARRVVPAARRSAPTARRSAPTARRSVPAARRIVPTARRSATRLNMHRS